MSAQLKPGMLAITTRRTHTRLPEGREVRLLGLVRPKVWAAAVYWPKVQEWTVVPVQEHCLAPIKT